MRITRSQDGIGHLLALLIIVVVVAVGFAGYTVWKAGQKDTETATTQSSAIKTKADLKNTATLLDTTASQLDDALDPSVLDADIDKLL